MGRENRKSVRIRNSRPVRVAAFDGKRIPSETRFVECKGHDLSTDGVAFLADQFAAKDEVVMRLDLPGIRDYYIAAEVARTNVDVVDSDSQTITGCRFKYGIEVVGEEPVQWYLMRPMEHVLSCLNAK